MMLTIPEAVLIVIITLLVIGLNKLQTISKAIARLRHEQTSPSSADSNADPSQ